MTLLIKYKKYNTKTITKNLKKLLIIGSKSVKLI